jgi:hypothetical protein
MMNTATATARAVLTRAGTGTGSGEWTNSLTRGFIRSRIDPLRFQFLVALDDLSVELPWGPNHAWGVARDRDLAEILGCSRDTVSRRWADAQEAGFIRRVPIRSITGRVVGRIGFVWLQRPTGRPVATEATFPQAEAELRAAVGSRKAQPRTLPFPADPPCTYCKPADPPTANLRTHLPQTCGATAAAPLMERARIGGSPGIQPETTTTELGGRSEAPTNTHACESSSSSPVSIPIRTPEAGPMTAPAGWDALLSACVLLLVRISARFRQCRKADGPPRPWSAEQARRQVLNWIGSLSCPPWWVWNALHHAAERPDAVRGRDPVHGPGFVYSTLRNWKDGDGDPGEPPDPEELRRFLEPPPAAKARSVTAAVDPADAAREERVRAAWEGLPEAERAAIRAVVQAENPGLRSPGTLKLLCLAKLERRL